ncbi:MULTISPECIES: PIN domain-containing protein [Streptomycetaceae]|uniref:PIN domain-containing protein n=1 Tax=Streptomycetaceae TaxID=2062 RepID=UPI00093DB7F7|nr:PIN domain-containing protein [Streptomyces sp. CB02056]
MTIFLDTNVLPRQRVVKNVIISTILRVAKAKGIAVAIPSIVLDESLSQRRQMATSTVESLSAAISAMSKLTDLDPIYIPGIEEIVADWEGQLRDAFQVIPVTGDDATEALQREALRKKPAKTDGTGARDAAIWLTVKRSHCSSPGDQTHFVSDNWRDFAASDKKSLHPDLAAEMSTGSQFHYHRKLEDLLSVLAVRRSIDVVPDLFGAEIRDDILSQVHALDDNMEIEWAGVAEGDVLDEHLTIEGSGEFSGYEVGESVVCYVKMNSVVEFSYESTTAHVPLEIGCWIQCDRSVANVAEISVERFSIKP